MKFLSFSFVTILVCTSVLHASDIRKANLQHSEDCGQTYGIAERDAITEAQERARQITPTFERVLPYRDMLPSERSYSYLVDPTYELEFDVPNVKDGRAVGILYPKGYQYNPLAYLSVIPPKLVIFNSSRKDEVRFVEKFYSDDLYTIFIVTGGDLAALSNRFKRPVYYLTDLMMQKLRLKNTVSVVNRSGRDRIKVDVFNAKEVLSNKYRGGTN